MPGRNTLGSRWSARSSRRSLTAILQRTAAQYDDAQLEAAFRDLHGPRLHGFAILVTLGETGSAERAAGFALAAGAAQAAALRHPERAAAWLRRKVLRGLHQRRSLGRLSSVESRRAALAALGVDEGVYRGLAALGIDARAALVASAIEGFDPIDVETILDVAPAAARHAVAEARKRYLRFAAGDLDDEDEATAAAEPVGELAARVQDVATRAFSKGEASR